MSSPTQVLTLILNPDDVDWEESTLQNNKRCLERPFSSFLSGLSLSSQKIGELSFAGPLMKGQDSSVFKLPIIIFIFMSWLDGVPVNVFRRGMRWPTESIQWSKYSINQAPLIPQAFHNYCPYWSLDSQCH